MDTLGWLVLNKQQGKPGQTSLPPDADDGDYDNYASVVLETFGMRYAVLAVRAIK